MDEELLKRILEPMLNSMLLSNSSRYNNKLANNIPTLKKTLELHAPFGLSPHGSYIFSSRCFFSMNVNK